MKKQVCLFFILLMPFFSIFAQTTNQLFVPKEVLKAYDNKTRSIDGKPGVNYFQNTTDYVIKAEFIPNSRTIIGKETIFYTNNSSDSLDKIVVKLYQDLFKKGAARDWDLGAVDLHDGVAIHSIKINSESVDLNTQIVRNSTIMNVKLTKKLVPHSKTVIEMEWSLVIPAKRNVRMGTYGETNFMVAYWYPKMAVYDDISGWNSIPHTGSCEYYNEYGNFDVEITVPGDYNVWSSGLLQNASEIYTEKFLTRIKEASTSDAIHHIITKADRETNEITKKLDKHTWKFKAENLPDFAFSLSNKYLWDATSIQIGNKRILVNAVYKENSTDFHEVAEISRFCVDYFSNVTPAIAYPYPQITVFNGSGGMEYPGMVNDGDARDHNGTVYVTSHEIGHTYFPFYVGTNEQKYAWIDEGLITFFPREIVGKLTKDKNYNPFVDMVKNYNLTAGSLLEVPLMISSTNTSESYRYHAYVRSSTAFYMLRELIGKEKFNEALQEYARRWNGKHPIPQDLFATVNDVVGEDLAWFWKPWFFELGSADLAIGDFKKNKLTIENKGGFPVPVRLKILYTDGSEKLITYKADVWKNGNASLELEIEKGSISKFILDSELIPDSNDKNNIKIL